MMPLEAAPQVPELDPEQLKVALDGPLAIPSGQMAHHGCWSTTWAAATC